MYVCVGTCVLWCSCGGQRVTCRNLFSPTTRAPGMELGSSELLTASTFIYRAFSAAPKTSSPFAFHCFCCSCCFNPGFCRTMWQSRASLVLSGCIKRWVRRRHWIDTLYSNGIDWTFLIQNSDLLSMDVQGQNSKLDLIKQVTVKI